MLILNLGNDIMSKSLDLQKIADELDFDLEDVEMLLEVFIESADESMAQLQEAVLNNNYEDMFNAAHAIKGSAANLTLYEISDLAKTIELNAKELYTFDYEKTLEELKQKIDNIK